MGACRLPRPKDGALHATPVACPLAPPSQRHLPGSAAGLQLGAGQGSGELPAGGQWRAERGGDGRGAHGHGDNSPAAGARAGGVEGGGGTGRQVGVGTHAFTCVHGLLAVQPLSTVCPSAPTLHAGCRVPGERLDAHAAHAARRRAALLRQGTAAGVCGTGGCRDLPGAAHARDTVRALGGRCTCGRLHQLQGQLEFLFMTAASPGAPPACPAAASWTRGSLGGCRAARRSST